MNKVQERTLEILKELVEKQKKTIYKKDREISKLLDGNDEELQELKNELEETNRRCCDNFIDCGIGKIEFKIPNNLQLNLLTEALKSSINKQGSLFVLEALQILSE